MNAPQHPPAGIRLAAALAAVLMTGLLAASQIGLAQHYRPAADVLAAPSPAGPANQAARLQQAADDRI